jgi:glycosyltransferase involved in cell wall biosynthesis
MPETPTVAYVLKGYPRRSEIFIASEIYRVERAGLRLRLFVLKSRDEEQHHPVVDRIRAAPHYLPDATSLSNTPLRRWLSDNLPAFRPSLVRVARCRPLGFARAALAAAAQSVRARRTFWSPPRKLYVKELFRAAALADALLDDPEVRHLHAHFAHGTTTVTWLAATITGLPFSFTAHAKDVYAPSLNPAGLLRRKLRAAQFAITCTDANVRHLRAVAPEATVHRVYHGLNADFTELVANGDGLAEARAGPVRVLAVGRLVPKKGFDTLLRAAALLTERGVDAEVDLVGEDGEQGRELRGLAQQLGLANRVRFRGALGQAELYAAYRSASVLCAPSRILDDGDRDGIPNVLAEAMACGVPVIATPVSGIPELVEDGTNGLLVQPDDADALADAVVRITKDAGLARRLGASGRATVAQRFDGERLADELAALFRQAVA